MGDILKIAVLAALAGGLFWLWRQGHLLRLSNYLQETRDELRKCTWPGKDELKGSTVVVMLSIILIGGFTVGVDALLWLLLQVVQTV
jgi:preprotein translocase SecE subunit